MARHRGRGMASINYPIGMNLGGDPSQALVPRDDVQAYLELRDLYFSRWSLAWQTQEKTSSRQKIGSNPGPATTEN